MTMGISGACMDHCRKQKSMPQEKQRKKEPGTELSEIAKRIKNKDTRPKSEGDSRAGMPYIRTT